MAAFNAHLLRRAAFATRLHDDLKWYRVPSRYGDGCSHSYLEEDESESRILETLFGMNTGFGDGRQKAIVIIAERHVSPLCRHRLLKFPKMYFSSIDLYYKTSFFFCFCFSWVFLPRKSNYFLGCRSCHRCVIFLMKLLTKKKYFKAMRTNKNKTLFYRIIYFLHFSQISTEVDHLFDKFFGLAFLCITQQYVTNNSLELYLYSSAANLTDKIVRLFLLLQSLFFLCEGRS